MYVDLEPHNAPKKSQYEGVKNDNGEVLCQNKNDDAETSNDEPGEDRNGIEDEADKNLETDVCNQNIQIRTRLPETPKKSTNKGRK